MQTDHDTASEEALAVVAQVMAEENVSRSELAKRLGVSRSVVSDTFRRRGDNLSIGKLARMLAALGRKATLTAPRMARRPQRRPRNGR